MGPDKQVGKRDAGSQFHNLQLDEAKCPGSLRGWGPRCGYSPEAPCTLDTWEMPRVTIPLLGHPGLTMTCPRPLITSARPGHSGNRMAML